MGWMSWKRDARDRSLEVGGQGRVVDQPRMDGAAIADALLSRGVARELSDTLSARLEARFASLDSQSRDVVLDAVAMSFVLQQEKSRELARNLKGLKEVERMMGAFSGELSKLDEVLDVLSAYVRRMRSTGSAETTDRILH